MKFDILDYPGNYVMHCKTEKEAQDFCNYLDSIGRRWTSGTMYIQKTNWGTYGKDTVYNFNYGSFADVDYYTKIGYTILEWEDFMNHTFTKADLKNGDIVLQRNGVVQVYIESMKVFMLKDGGWNDAEKYNDDLTRGGEFDIVAVRRPRHKHECTFEAFDMLYGTLVYDRERDDVEEMTLAEVCKLLGKNIKIIK